MTSTEGVRIKPKLEGTVSEGDRRMGVKIITQFCERHTLAWRRRGGTEWTWDLKAVNKDRPSDHAMEGRRTERG